MSPRHQDTHSSWRGRFCDLGAGLVLPAQRDRHSASLDEAAGDAQRLRPKGRHKVGLKTHGYFCFINFSTRVRSVAIALITF